MGDDPRPTTGSSCTRCSTLGILGSDGRLLATSTAVIAGITYNFLPFMVLPLYVSLEQIDHRLIEAARGPLRVASRRRSCAITLPLSLPGVFAGVLLTFIPAAGDFINAQLLGTPRQYMIGNVIQSEFLAMRDYPTAAALSFILMAAILVMVLAFAKHPRHRPADGGRVRFVRRHVADGLRGARARVPVPADRGRDRVLVQQPGGPLQLHLAGLHAEELAAPVRLPGPAGRAQGEHRDRAPLVRSPRRFSGR